MPDSQIPASLEEGVIDPKEAQKLEKAIKSKEAAPTVSEQTGSFADWKRIRDELGQPFDAEHVPLRKLKQMRRDPMIAFGLHYITVPMVRAMWHMEARDKDGPNAQVTGFMTEAWRKIHTRFMLQACLSLSFGFQSIVKRFVEANPGGVYEDPNEENPENRVKPVWDEGNVQPIIWKPFVPLKPERVEPMFKESGQGSGQFNGILYEISPAERRGGLAFSSRSAKGNQNQREIDVYRSLWLTHDRDSQFGSLYGFPRIAHAYRYWWSYWYNWAQRDRAFERIAVPPLVAYHPEGDWTDPENPDEKTPYSEIAIRAAESLRANAVAAVPSTLASSGLEEKGTDMREWEFKFLETPTINFDHFNQAFNYLDVLKLRSTWVPEQAFIEGEGGTSSRNVAAQMGEVFIQSLGLLWDDIADHVNRFVLPQLLVVNFPEFVNNGGSCQLVGHGFAKADIDLLKQLIQLVGQSDPMLLGVDIREGLRQLNIPLLQSAEYAKIEDLIAQRVQGQPATAAPGRGNVGVLPSNGNVNPGFTAGGSVPEPAPPGSAVAGFSEREREYMSASGFNFSTDGHQGPYLYLPPTESIELSAESDFLSSLPDSKHYEDSSIRALSVQLRRLWSGHFRAIYTEFYRWLSKQSVNLDEFEVDESDQINLADKQQVGLRKAEKAAKKLIDDFVIDSQRMLRLTQSSSRTITRMLRRSLALERTRIGRQIDIPSETTNEWIDTQVGKLIKRTHETLRDELQSFLVARIREGKDADALSKEVREHFAEFDGYKSNRLARSEARDAVNAATLMTAQAANFRFVRAKDAQQGPTDDECEERDGKLYTVREAWKQMIRVHPNDTLEFEPIARANFSIETVATMPENAEEGEIAFYDPDNDTAYIHRPHINDNRLDGWLTGLAEILIEEDRESEKVFA